MGREQTENYTRLGATVLRVRLDLKVCCLAGWEDNIKMAI
jgi:hypothetical protein